MPEFQDGQIIYLQHDGMRLYAETIQVIEARQLCWARPLALLQLPDRPIDDFQPLCLRDLRQGSDLLLPTSLFNVALDVDAIPVLAQLSAPKTDPPETLVEGKSITFPLLHQFIQQVWQAYPEQFVASSRG
jgi:hypothetical protein